jgi:hypothetical protein
VVVTCRAGFALSSSISQTRSPARRFSAVAHDLIAMRILLHRPNGIVYG